MTKLYRLKPIEWREELAGVVYVSVGVPWFRVAHLSDGGWYLESRGAPGVRHETREEAQAAAQDRRDQLPLSMLEEVEVLDEQ